VVLIVAAGNYAEGAPVSASSGQNPAAAVDGNDRTAWMPTSPVPQWIELNLKVPVTIGSMELITNQQRTEPTIHEVWVTTEAGDFLPIRTFRGTTSDGQKLQARLETPVDNVVRVRIATVQSGGGVGWREPARWLRAHPRRRQPPTASPSSPRSHPCGPRRRAR
jgi:hypothetical protein